MYRNDPTQLKGEMNQNGIIYIDYGEANPVVKLYFYAQEVGWLIVICKVLYLSISIFLVIKSEQVLMFACLATTGNFSLSGIGVKQGQAATCCKFQKRNGTIFKSIHSYFQSSSGGFVVTQFFKKKKYLRLIDHVITCILQIMKMLEKQNCNNLYKRDSFMGLCYEMSTSNNKGATY